MGEIRSSEVRIAAGVIEDVAGTVGKEVPDEVGQIARALPGSRSGGAGTALSTTWSDAFTSWATDAESLAQYMRDAAANWDAADLAAAAQIQHAGSPLFGPPAPGYDNPFTPRAPQTSSLWDALGVPPPQESPFPVPVDDVFNG